MAEDEEVIKRAMIDRGAQLHAKVVRADQAYSHHSWQDDAACGGIDPDKFMVSRRGDPDVREARGVTIRNHNVRKMTTAKVVCDGCPVRATCLKEADESDLFWTMRGGQWPTSMRAAGAKNKKSVPSSGRRGTKPFLDDQSECPSGHVGRWKARADREGKYCHDCNSSAVKRFYERQALAESGSLVG